MRQALGLVEIQGLCTAVVAADAMLKSANVALVEIENARGSGYITVKVVGDVGAVTAAVNVGKQVGVDNQKLISYKVIARPADPIETTFCKPLVEAKKQEEVAKAEEARKKAEAERKAEETRKKAEEARKKAEAVRSKTKEAAKPTAKLSSKTTLKSAKESAEETAKPESKPTEPGKTEKKASEQKDIEKKDSEKRTRRADDIM
ncbi:MAG: BMC domain-containing protein [Hespellia sp.]|nr:BMC domain-containing protein [Hespellia sp.]